MAQLDLYYDKKIKAEENNEMDEYREVKSQIKTLKQQILN